MNQTQIKPAPKASPEEETAESLPRSETKIDKEALDKLLDDIEHVLDEQSLIKEYVQQGGE